MFETRPIGLLGGIIGIAFSYVLSFFINKYGAGIMGSLVGKDAAGELSVKPFRLPFVATAFGMSAGLLSGNFRINLAYFAKIWYIFSRYREEEDVCDLFQSTC